jgi:hypothetical protein
MAVKVPTGWLVNKKCSVLTGGFGDHAEIDASSTDAVMARWVLPAPARIIEAGVDYTVGGNSHDVSGLDLDVSGSSILSAAVDPDNTAGEHFDRLTPATPLQEYAAGVDVQIVITTAANSTVTGAGAYLVVEWMHGA